MYSRLETLILGSLTIVLCYTVRDFAANLVKTGHCKRWLRTGDNCFDGIFWSGITRWSNYYGKYSVMICRAFCNGAINVTCDGSVCLLLIWFFIIQFYTKILKKQVISVKYDETAKYAENCIRVKPNLWQSEYILVAGKKDVTLSEVKELRMMLISRCNGNAADKLRF